uniref:Reverse transcriptase domain-containing protein n=1 Tax=Tanacetum cinerariifolium TaxID=118510 RepID=A0A6L2M757_TANCI|nr:reverse transcriptase domain-containing protein [Tanacetum cinerariifolium]
MDKIRRDKRKEVHARLDFREGSREKRIREGSHYSSARSPSARYHNQSKRLKVRDRLRYNDWHVLDRLGQAPGIVLVVEATLTGRTLLMEIVLRVETTPAASRNHMITLTPSTDQPQILLSRQRPLPPCEEGRDSESLLIRVSESGSSDGGHWKTGDPEDHINFFQAAAQVECWAMPTWCHMFNSTLIGAARVWFDELSPKSINSYKDLKAAFLAYFMRQKKYVKDYVEIHNIKQKDGETIEDFMERFKVETRRMKGTPECMRFSGFMHGVNNPELTKHLNEHVPKNMEEMMITTTAFIRVEAVAFGKKKGHTSWTTQDQSKRHTSEKRSDFRGQPRKRKGSSREITFPLLATSSGTEGLLVIEAEIGGHMIHRMYVDGGSSTEVLYEHCFNRLRLKVKNQMVPATTSLTGFSGETIWPLGQLRLLSSDMTGVLRSVAEHRLNIREGYSPVRKKKRGQASECSKVIQAEVEKLVEAGIIREVYYHDWLSNPVMIQLAESNEEKTAFYTGQGVYCYTKTPFGLKNTGAMYQRLVDKVFDSQISQNIEVYVDDLVIKSHTEAKMLIDIGEMFRTLRKINMKLNPKKCTFGVVEGMFLGYMITLEGIKPCPDKTKVVLQLPSPRTIKEVQSLNGKLASLNRVLSKSAEKSLPLFKTLKKCIKKSDFHWTSKAEQAFKQQMQHLSELPLLVAPKPKEELIVYMFASYEAISAVLMTERGTVQTLVYIVSHALQGLKLNYTPMEKLVLSLVFSTKRLRRYFQAHPSIMLGEYNITYWPRTLVKGQVLADFLAVMPDESPPDASVVKTQQEPWTLFTDGSSCVDGFGTGLILTNPEGTEFTYALRFQFAASNNEAEYEALIAGLRIIAQMGVRNVHVSVDSKLVANQVLGAYVAKEENMIKYLEMVKSLVSDFANFSINQVSRSKNKKADSLSKITSTSFVHLSKQVLVEILKEKSIQEKEVKTVVEEDGPTWMTPIIEYLKEGTLLSDRKEASKLRIKARQYELLEGVLYRQSFLTSWLRCVRPLQSLREGIKARLGEGNKNWIEELPHVLWAHRTMRKSSHGYTPYSLTYGTEAIILAEIGMPTYRTATVDAVHNDEELRLNLDLLEE